MHSVRWKTWMEGATWKNPVYHQNGSYLYGGRVWVGFVWLGIRTSVVLLWTRLWTFGLYKGGYLNKCVTHCNNENEIGVDMRYTVHQCCKELRVSEWLPIWGNHIFNTDAASRAGSTPVSKWHRWQIFYLHLRLSATVGTESRIILKKPTNPVK